MAADPVIRNPSGVVRITLAASFTCKPGDLLGYSSGWKGADADGRIKAELVAMDYGDGDQDGSGADDNVPYNVISACRAGTLLDTDAPYTAGDIQYLSATAKAHTATLPAITTTLTIIQRIGRATSTSEVVFDLHDSGPIFLRASAAVNPASGGTDTVQNLAVTVTGVLATDYAILGSNPALAQGVIMNGSLVCTADTITCGIANASAGTVDGASVTVEFGIFRFV